VLQYLIRRLLWACVLFVAVTAVTYVIFFIIPANPAKLACGQACSKADVDRIAHALGTDRPIYVQYAKFLKHLVWDRSLGYSYFNRQPVNGLVGAAAPVTASLVFGGAILWMLIAIPIGVLSALRPRSLLDRVSMTFVLVGISAHPIWIGLVLSYVFGYVPTSGHALGFSFPSFTFLPIQGYCNLRGASQGQLCSGPIQWFYHLILPWITFAILYAAFYVRMIRANVMETLNEDYVRTARAKGLAPRSVLGRHVLRNSLIPIVSLFGLDFAAVLGGGAILTETVFDLKGVGWYAAQSVGDLDLPPIMGVTLYGAFFIVVFTAIVDFLYAYLDPRIRPT
jgi:peptide/nickel transport system permease protein